MESIRIALDGDIIFNEVTGENICNIADLADKEKALYVINQLMTERDEFEIMADSAIERIEELEDDLRMYEDNYCGTFNSWLED